MCSHDQVLKELDYIRNSLVEMGYPNTFIKRYIDIARGNKSGTIIIQKKLLLMKLQFNGDVAGKGLYQRLSRVIKRTFHATQLCLSFSSRPIITAQKEDKLSSFVISMCIYKFSCSCGESYVGRTTRQLNKRVAEHLPSWLGKGQIKSIRRSVLSHLIDSGHSVDKNITFTIIHHIPSHLSKGIQPRLLRITEAVGI
ncbi:unnamed protein product [Heterobilharzia americana]|nr:unnamed protein product [Heterobilharzia americana]